MKKLLAISLAMFIFVLGFGITESFAESNELFIKSDILYSQTIPDPNSLIIDSETVTVNLDVLDSDTITITLFDKTFEATKDYVDFRSENNYAWTASGDWGVAVLTVIDSEIYGKIQTHDGVFIIEPTGLGLYAINEVDVNLGGDYHPDTDLDALSTAAQRAYLTVEEWKQIDTLQNSYVHTRDYRPNTVTIDVVVGYTQLTADEIGERKIKTKIQRSIDTANHANQALKLPVKLVLMDTEKVRGYEEKSLIALDRIALGDNSERDLNRLRALSVNADVMILLTYPGDTKSEIEKYGCGAASQILAQSHDLSFAVIAYPCLDGVTMGHEIGHLQGAAHNKDYIRFGDMSTKNPWSHFPHGHGFYSVKDQARTMMSYDCDSSETDGGERGKCTAWELWSDPNQPFFGTVTPTGTEKEN